MKSWRAGLTSSLGRILRAVTLGAALVVATAHPAVVAATQIDIIGPEGSGMFGFLVTALPNGNIVVTDPEYDSGPIINVGAVYLYDSATGALISMLTGSTAGDRVGERAVVVLNNGNCVVISHWWDNAALGAVDAGAVTWVSATTGLNGVVSSANSLVGTTANDMVGIAVEGLSNGNYVVSSPGWDNGAAEDAGAVTWGNGATGIAGPVSAANSLVGSAAGDRVGEAPLSISGNGNYIVKTIGWDNSTLGAADAGAVTWVNGMTGLSGVISMANSLVGATTGDKVGYYGLWELSNGNYVVASPLWDNGAAVDAGAVTWFHGTTGISGTVSAANSLVGSTTGDQIGSDGLIRLSNGNYVVRSHLWDNGGVSDVGAVTWGNGATGTSGVVSAANSLMGGSLGDTVGSRAVTALDNGNYVVISPYWDNGGVWDAGAVTWGSGTTGVNGLVSAANSLVGTSPGDRVGCEGEDCGGYLTELSNGNYVIRSPYWDNGPATDAGAVTWGNGATGIAGPVSAANSLVGGTAGDKAGAWEVLALSNGNYVVSNPYWHKGLAVDVGAVTWGSGTTGVKGAVSAANSLMGSRANDMVGYGAREVGNGNYVVASPYWDNWAVWDAGAVTWGSGITGVKGTVSAANSLIGGTAGDRVGGGCLIILSNGSYVVASPNWTNGSAAYAGAVTWGNGTTGVQGAVSMTNSLVGSTTDDQVGVGGVTALSSGHYVVHTPYWDNGAVADVGAVTWGDGTTGISGPVSAANSLVGSTAYDQVGSGYFGVRALGNGNYVVASAHWDNGAISEAGAVTWGSGTTGISGEVSAANSLVGSTAGDRVGYVSDFEPGVAACGAGNYVVRSPSWDNAPVGAADAGAVTWGGALTGVAGAIAAENSVLGTTAGGGSSMVWSYDHRYPISQLVVGRPADNIVSLFKLSPVHPVFLPVVLKNAL